MLFGKFVGACVTSFERYQKNSFCLCSLINFNLKALPWATCSATMLNSHISMNVGCGEVCYYGDEGLDIGTLEIDSHEQCG
jgi:hypothetical protein